jgi:hypothetical protein
MRRVSALALVIAVSACSTTTQAARAAFASLPPGSSSVVQCDSGCTIQWQRAQIWLANHSPMKIQTATDVLLQTYNPTGYDPKYGFSVMKSPQSRAGSYMISMEMHCGNPLGCEPDARDVERAFAHYVSTGEDVLAGVHPGMSLR